MHMKRNNIIAIASVIVTLCIGGVAIWQGYVAQEYKCLSVKPKLDIIEGHDPNPNNAGRVEYNLGNFGVGLATIKDFVLIYDDEEISRNDFNSYLAFMQEQQNQFPDLIWSRVDPEMEMSVDEKITLLKFSYDENTMSDAEEFFRNFDFLVTYYSMCKGEVFEFDTRSSPQTN